MCLLTEDVVGTCRMEESGFCLTYLHYNVTPPTTTNNMLFVLVRSRGTGVCTDERVCNCLFRYHYMLFVLVRRRVTCVFTDERVCNCLFRCHYMLFVLVRSRGTGVFTHE